LKRLDESMYWLVTATYFGLVKVRAVKSLWHWAQMKGNCFSFWWDASSWEQKSEHQWTKEFKTCQKIYPFDWFTVWNTQVSFFTNSHFQPMQFPFLSNALSLTQLIRCSLSFFLSLYLYLVPTLFHLLPFDTNTLMILYALLLNKLNWTNTVFHLGNRSQ
jgi:hypothetical protein